MYSNEMVEPTEIVPETFSFAYAVTGSDGFEDGQDDIKADAMVYT